MFHHSFIRFQDSIVINKLLECEIAIRTLTSHGRTGRIGRTDGPDGTDGRTDGQNTVCSSTGTENTVYSSTGTEKGFTLSTILFLGPTKNRLPAIYLLIILQYSINMLMSISMQFLTKV